MIYSANQRRTAFVRVLYNWFLNYVPLLEMGRHFEEFGQDVAVAISMTRNREMQLKKIEGIEWITKNLSIDSPFEDSIEEVTTRAGKGTNAEFACIYLYNDQNNSFIFKSPSYGDMTARKQVKIEHRSISLFWKKQADPN